MRAGPSSLRALVLAPRGRDGSVAVGMLAEAGIPALPCATLDGLLERMNEGVGMVVVTEEALTDADLRPLSDWLGSQEEWSDLPFVLLTFHGGGLERNPAAARHLELLGNVAFLERPFHPTTLISLCRASLRGRRRQYEARARLQALRDSEDHYRHAVELNPQVAWTATPDGQLDHVGPRWEAWTGKSGVGAGWGAAMHPDDLEPSLAAWRHSVESGEPYDIEHRVRLVTGEHHWMHSRAFARRDGAGAIVRWYGTTEDVEERRAAEDAVRQYADVLEARVEAVVAERAAAMAQLHEAQKLETLGQLTGGVAHDFNNLLTPVIGALDLLRRRHEEARDARLIDGALQSAERAKTLVQRLLAFARRQTLQPRAVDAAALVDGMRDLVRRSIGPGIAVEVDVAPGLPAALVDPNQLELALLNLCVNARDAMPEGGRLRIAADADAEGEEMFVRLRVSDTGAGMDAATLARATEPFFTTKALGEGTGLGLSMVHGLAAQSGGSFSLRSSPGAGTTAELRLPVSRHAADAPRPVADDALRAPRGATLLLVDDEELVRAGTAEGLREIGYSVIEAASAAAALGQLGGGLRPDAMVTDHAMPGMTGADLAREVKRLLPGLPVLMITGYANLSPEQVAGVEVLAKPFRHAELAGRVAAMLRRRAPERAEISLARTTH